MKMPALGCAPHYRCSFVFIPSKVQHGFKAALRSDSCSQHTNVSLVTGCYKHTIRGDLWLQTALYADSSEGPQLKSHFTSKYIESKIIQVETLPSQELSAGKQRDARFSANSETKWV